ncbi:MAG TPA: cytochrome c family protein [Stellaceae bacterium]|jgi:cytochrome c|nr:cytochrome c family protein [Stellaceae bacterium]
MSFEANKIAGAILAAMILAMVSGLVANMLVHPQPLQKPAYAVAGGEETAETSTSSAPKGPEPIAPLIAAADAKAGEEKAKLCVTCHTFTKGGPNKIGPNLYGIVGDQIAHDRNGFAFSEALTDKGKGQTWTLANLNDWLYKPQSFARGTKMTFIGLPKAQDRANVVAYLNSLSDSPKPLASLAPPAAQAAGGESKPAAGESGKAAPAANADGKAAPAANGKAAPPAGAAAPPKP